MQYKTTWHIFHAIMTLLTTGLWSIVWLACWASNSQYNKRLDRMRMFSPQQATQPTIIYVERPKSE